VARASRSLACCLGRNTRAAEERQHFPEALDLGRAGGVKLRTAMRSTERTPLRPHSFRAREDYAVDEQEQQRRTQYPFPMTLRAWVWLRPQVLHAWEYCLHHIFAGNAGIGLSFLTSSALLVGLSILLHISDDEENRLLAWANRLLLLGLIVVMGVDAFVMTSLGLFRYIDLRKYAYRSDGSAFALPRCPPRCQFIIFIPLLLSHLANYPFIIGLFLTLTTNWAKGTRPDTLKSFKTGMALEALACVVWLVCRKNTAQFDVFAAAIVSERRQELSRLRLENRRRRELSYLLPALPRTAAVQRHLRPQQTEPELEPRLCHSNFFDESQEENRLREYLEGLARVVVQVEDEEEEKKDDEEGEEGEEGEEEDDEEEVMTRRRPASPSSAEY